MKAGSLLSALLVVMACASVDAGAGEYESTAGEAESHAETSWEESDEDAGSTDSSGSEMDDGSIMPDLPPEEPHCCGCLCVDLTWSCSQDNCQNEEGEAIGLNPEAGFFFIEGGDYRVNAQDVRVAHARVWYSFEPAAQAPQDAPLVVAYNGGPGSSSGPLRVYNLGRWTMDEDLAGPDALAATSEPWTEFVNLLVVDAPNTGFSYSLELEGGERPSVSIDPERDAAAVLRVILRFLERHPDLLDNRVVLAGESYGGVRSQLILRHLYERATLLDGDYQDPELAVEIDAHLARVFPEQLPEEVDAFALSEQFGEQILLQALVAGTTQMNVPVPYIPPGCFGGGDLYQCDEPDGYTFDRIYGAAAGLVNPGLLEQLLGVDPLGIEWLAADAREGAYGRGAVGREESAIVDRSAMQAELGELGPDDAYYVAFNWEVFAPHAIAQQAMDPSMGELFVRNAWYVDAFITDGALDRAIWSPNLAVALENYPLVLASVLHDTESPVAAERPGELVLEFAAASLPAGVPAMRRFRFPHYASSGHMVNLRQPGELVADLREWLEL